MCSTQDNARRCPEEPRLPLDKRPDRNVETNDSKTIGEHTVVVKIKDYKLPDSGKALGRAQAPPRDPRSRISSSNFQRVDSMLHGGRLSALSILISNKVTNAAHPHAPGWRGSTLPPSTRTLPLSPSRSGIALVPGLRNQQEKFSNRQAGPSVSARRARRPSRRWAASAAAMARPRRRRRRIRVAFTRCPIRTMWSAWRWPSTPARCYDDVGTSSADKCTEQHKDRLGEHQV